MKTIRSDALAVLIAGSGLLLLLSCAQQAGIGSPDRATAPTAGTTHRAPLREAVSTTVADEPIPNLPGKRLVSRVIDYPPGGGLPAHRHAPSAFIYAHVLTGEIRSKVDDEPARLYRPGETWFEKPGVHHQVSVNASDTKPARLLAVLIVDAADEQLTILDPQ
jgi:quercetin dioxygenase-like cupin family protein